MTEKEIVVTKKIYVAVDGKEFEDRNECFKYEREAFAKAEEVLHEKALWMYDGDNIYFLDGNIKGYCADAYYLVRVDTWEIVEALNIMATTTWTGFKAQKIIKERIANAWSNHSLVLVSVYDNDSLFWYGTLEEVKATLLKEADSLFEVK